MTGRVMDDFVGKINFWLLFIGFNLTFFPMHILGLRGMTRRIYTYPQEMGWEPMNALATVGAFVILAGGIVFILNAVNSRKHGDDAGPNPWDAGTLEWAAASPPANYNFVNLPAATSRYPLWSDPKERVVVSGLRDDRREVLVTTLMDAEPHHRYVLPSSTIWPFATAVLSSVGLVGSIFNFAWYYVACAGAFVGLVGWFWPRRRVEAEQ
jgi:cytochrome c oxidase subunit 1